MPIHLSHVLRKGRHLLPLWVGFHLVGCVPNEAGISPDIAQQVRIDNGEDLFVRGDANGDGIVDVADGVAIAFVIYEGRALNCNDAADVNDDGVLDVADAIVILNEEDLIAEPTTKPGPDPTPDDLDCEFYDAHADPSAVSPTLIVNDRATLLDAGLTFEAVMNQIVNTSPDPETQALDLYQQWWRDLGGDGCPQTLNGFENSCDRTESILGETDPFSMAPSTFLADALDADVVFSGILPVAAVNRFDLADKAYSTCGEYRLVFALKQPYDGLGPGFVVDNDNRNFIIFEFEAPNPGEGLEGCMPLLEAWSALDCSKGRADGLYDLFLGGLSEPDDALVRYEAVSSTGRIRTSTRMGSGTTTWMFREFRAQMEEGSVHIRQVPVQETVHFPVLSWSSLGAVEATLSAIPDLSAPETGAIDLGPLGQPSFLAPYSEATSDGREQAWRWISGDFGMGSDAAIQSVETAADPLTAKNIYDRITAKSCVGCHAKWAHQELGGGLESPRAMMVQHITEGGHLSPYLRLEALPQRRAHWDSVVGSPTGR